MGIEYECFIKVPERGIGNAGQSGKQYLRTKEPPGRAGILIFKMEGCGWCEKAKAALHIWSEKTKRPVYTADSKLSIVGEWVPKIEGFPTIYAVDAKGRIVPGAYDGERTPEGFEKFVTRVASR